MSVNVLVEVLATGEYSATVLGWPEMTARGSTEEDAIGRLREAVEQRLERGKIVPLDLGVGAVPNPWLEIAERFRDNPLLDEVEQAIRDDRELSNERGLPSERGVPSEGGMPVD